MFLNKTFLGYFVRPNSTLQAQKHHILSCHGVITALKLTIWAPKTAICDQNSSESHRVPQLPLI